MPRQMRNEHSAVSAVLHMLGTVQCPNTGTHCNRLRMLEEHCSQELLLYFTSGTCLLLLHNDTPVLQSKAKEADASVYTISAVTSVFLTQ
jgi:hypothetical protein